MKFHSKRSCLPSLCILLIALASVVAVSGQSPTPTATPSGSASDSGINSTVELGVRGVHVNGNNDKYRSDLNYRPGFRIFDSSFLIESKPGSNFFDSAMVTTSGWGGDPTGTGMPAGATLVVVAALMPPDLAATLHRLRSEGHAVHVVKTSAAEWEMSLSPIRLTEIEPTMRILEEDAPPIRLPTI